jgi:hypothetical protein
MDAGGSPMTPHTTINLTSDSEWMIQKYLEAVKDTEIQEQYKLSTEEKIAPAIAEAEAAEARLINERAAAEPIRAKLSADVEEADHVYKETRSRYVPLLDGQLDLYKFDESKYSQEFLDARRAHFSAIEDLKAKRNLLQKDGPDERTRPAESAVRSCRSEVDRQVTAAKRAAENVQSCKSREIKTKAEITPAAFQNLPIDVLRDVVSLLKQENPLEKWEEIEENYDWPEYSTRQIAAIIRGELEQECACHQGYVYRRFQHIEYPLTLRVLQHDEIVHTICHARSLHNPNLIEEHVPRLFTNRHKDHRLLTLAPFAENTDIPGDKQQRLIDGIQSDLIDYSGWLLTGPGGTSKTTYVAAALVDTLTFRAYAMRNMRKEAPHMCCWRIKVPAWLADTERWLSRDYADKRVKEPEITEQSIREACTATGYLPILWLEELDKVSPTTPRRNFLFALVDLIYEFDGTIVATTNMDPERLRKHIDNNDYPIIRRITGKNDQSDRFMVWDLWKHVAKPAKKTAELSSANPMRSLR